MTLTHFELQQVNFLTLQPTFQANFINLLLLSIRSLDPYSIRLMIKFMKPTQILQSKASFHILTFILISLSIAVQIGLFGLLLKTLNYSVQFESP